MIKGSLIAAISMLMLIGFQSCKKNFERIMYVTTTSVSSDTYLVRGELVDPGTNSAEYGFCYSTSSNPTLTNGTILKLGSSSSYRSFQATLSGLGGGSYYYVRAYAKSSQGTVYGSALKFWVGSSGTELVYDDGDSDYGWIISAGYNGWFGNLFPVSSMGAIIGARAYFSANSNAGSDYVSFDFFDANGNLLGGSGSFFPTADTWSSVSGLSISYVGNFYGMIHWNNTSQPTNWLSMDQDGPNVSMDLGFELYNGSFIRASSISGGNQKPGIFLLRVTVLESKSDGSKVIRELDPLPVKTLTPEQLKKNTNSAPNAAMPMFHSK